MKKILVINNGTIHLKKLLSLLPEEVTVVDYTNITPPQIREADIFILTGSSTLPVRGNEKVFSKETGIILSSGKPVIGICLGCELIATAFGATLKSLGQKRQGLINIVATPSKDHILEAGRNFSVYEGHKWAIDSLPLEIFDILAQSPDGPEIIKHRTLPLWGFQFHPEHMTDETLGDEIFLNILHRSLHA